MLRLHMILEYVLLPLWQGEDGEFSGSRRVRAGLSRSHTGKVKDNSRHINVQKYEYAVFSFKFTTSIPNWLPKDMYVLMYVTFLCVHISKKCCGREQSQVNGWQGTVFMHTHTLVLSLPLLSLKISVLTKNHRLRIQRRVIRLSRVSLCLLTSDPDDCGVTLLILWVFSWQCAPWARGPSSRTRQSEQPQLRRGQRIQNLQLPERTRSLQNTKHLWKEPLRNSSALFWRTRSGNEDRLWERQKERKRNVNQWVQCVQSFQNGSIKW